MWSCSWIDIFLQAFGNSFASNAVFNSLISYVDENGVALREDVLHSLQGTISGSRRRPRILTSASSSPLMAKVVTSAIRVSNHQPITDGKYVPQVIDLKIGKWHDSKKLTVGVPESIVINNIYLCYPLYKIFIFLTLCIFNKMHFVSIL